MKSLAAAVMLAVLPALPAAANDARLAYGLFEQGSYAEAAEIFTDPAWKGAALYRSEQYWRAAEAYIRADDTDSLYNLGNCYVQLGYLELALEAYLGVLEREPGHTDAAHNAELMRELLKSRDKGQGEATASPQPREIEQLDGEQEAGGRPDAAEGGSREEQQSAASGEQQSGGEDPQGEGRSGDGGNGEEQRVQAEADRTANAEGAAAGEEQAGMASGRSEAAEAALAEAAAMRTMLEESQADEQWLNQIEDDPASFLKKRIALEMRRRKAAGVLPVTDDEAW